MENSSSMSTKEVSTNTKAENATSWAGTTAEKRLVRKLDMRIMPLTCIAYFFACELFFDDVLMLLTTYLVLDRSNPGNGRLQGLPEDVLGGDPTGKLFDLISSGFFLSYVRTISCCYSNAFRTQPLPCLDCLPDSGNGCSQIVSFSYMARVCHNGVGSCFYFGGKPDIHPRRCIHSNQDLIGNCIQLSRSLHLPNLRRHLRSRLHTRCPRLLL